MLVDLTWHTIALEVIERSWLVFAAFGGLQIIVLRRIPKTSGFPVITAAVLTGTGVSWAAASWLCTLTLPEAIAGFLAHHPWSVGVIASLAGVPPVTAVCLLAPRTSVARYFCPWSTP